MPGASYLCAQEVVVGLGVGGREKHHLGALIRSALTSSAGFGGIVFIVQSESRVGSVLSNQLLLGIS